jgi:hypothetical protein
VVLIQPAYCCWQWSSSSGRISLPEMWVKLILLLLFCLMIVGAVHFAHPRASEESSRSSTTVVSLRLLTFLRLTNGDVAPQMAAAPAVGKTDAAD